MSAYVLIEQFINCMLHFTVATFKMRRVTDLQITSESTSRVTLKNVSCQPQCDMLRMC